MELRTHVHMNINIVQRLARRHSQLICSFHDCSLFYTTATVFQLHLGTLHKVDLQMAHLKRTSFWLQIYIIMGIWYFLSYDFFK